MLKIETVCVAKYLGVTAQYPDTPDRHMHCLDLHYLTFYGGVDLSK